jgi:transcriptional regulator with XRE-family HTH domain
MAAFTPAVVNSPVLASARQESGYALDLVAKRLNVKPERLFAWERGESKTTVRQAQGIAKLYHRPFGVFFLPQPPVLPPLAAEYRSLPGVRPGVESPEFHLTLRLMSQRCEMALELSEELDVPVAEFSITAHLSDTPTVVGVRLREALGIPVRGQIGWTSEWQARHLWRESVESAGVLVFQVFQGECRPGVGCEFGIALVGLEAIWEGMT